MGTAGLYKEKLQQGVFKNLVSCHQKKPLDHSTYGTKLSRNSTKVSKQNLRHPQATELMGHVPVLREHELGTGEYSIKTP